MSALRAACLPPPAKAASESEHVALLVAARACLLAKGVSLWQLSGLASRLGSAAAIIEGDYQPETPWEVKADAAIREAAPELARWRAELGRSLDQWQRSGLRLTTVLDEDYPLNLRYVYDRPPFLFYRGELRDDDGYALAVVGTRRPSDAGRRRATRLARLLCERGVTVLSGLATGIDAAAHQATLDHDGRTIAILGHGLSRPLYPKENRVLGEQIAERGALVSMFFPDTPPSRATFPLRNTVTSGMGQGTIVVEAGATSGSRLQARLATEHGKHAFLLASLVSSHEWARQFATRDGVLVVNEVDDVLARLTSSKHLASGLGETDGRASSQPPVYLDSRADRAHRHGQQRLL